RLSATTGALEPNIAHRPGPLMPAARTAKSVGPAQLHQVLAAGLLGCEAGLELHQIARIILHSAAYYILGSPESSGYPTNIQFETNAIYRALSLRFVKASAVPSRHERGRPIKTE